jgi:hypothetical protein
MRTYGVQYSTVSGLGRLVGLEMSMRDDDPGERTEFMIEPKEYDPADRKAKGGEVH